MRKVWLALVVASLGWGTAGVSTRTILNSGVGPYAVAAIRAVFASVGIIIYLILRREGRPQGRVVWQVGLVMGVTNFTIPNVASNIALEHASAGFLGLMTALIPLFTALIAHVFLVDEPLTRSRFAGVALGLAGVAILILSGDSGLAEGGDPVLAGLLGLVAVISIAAGGIYAKHHAGSYRPAEVTSIQFVSGAILSAAAMLAFEGIPGAISGPSWALFVYIGLGSTVVPFLLYYWMIRTVSATFASMAGYLVTFVAVGAGVIFLSEQLQSGIIVGGLLIVLGVLTAERAERRAALRVAQFRS